MKFSFNKYLYFLKNPGLPVLLISLSSLRWFHGPVNERYLEFQGFLLRKLDEIAMIANGQVILSLAPNLLAYVRFLVSLVFRWFGQSCWLSRRLKETGALSYQLL